jgi:hypothetical protein
VLASHDTGDDGLFPCGIRQLHFAIFYINGDV